MPYVLTLREWDIPLLCSSIRRLLIWGVSTLWLLWCSYLTLSNLTVWPLHLPAVQLVEPSAIGTRLVRLQTDMGSDNLSCLDIELLQLVRPEHLKDGS